MAIESGRQPARAHNFSLAFEQMCSIVAISQSRNSHDTIRELILQCFAILPNEGFKNAAHLGETIDALFGLQLPEHEVVLALDSLITDGFIINGASGAELVVDATVLTGLRQKIDASLALEVRVQKGWLDAVAEMYPLLNPTDMWHALRRYLASAFRRHGVQAVALLDPSTNANSSHTEGLSELLTEAVSEIPEEQRALARSAISGFLASAAANADRATYIAQLADGAFSYYSLTIAPEVAAHFRANLNPLSLFLDTNFIYGVLGLNVNPQVAVSHALLAAIENHELPFTLYYHFRTEQEFRRSVALHRESLISRRWSDSIVRAALTSRNLSGIELNYYSKYLETGIDVDTFLLPFAHVDILLNEKNVRIYRPTGDRTREQSVLVGQYHQFLTDTGLEKSDKVVEHDSIVLDTVRTLRTKATSSLEAGALLITCDYRLFRFDWETSRRLGMPACTVLPNLLWQVLRPILPMGSDFDRTFAATFAIPEFRTIGSGAAKAASRMLHILAAYREFPEETATRMLSNDVLIQRLQSAKDDAAFIESVESAIASENAALLREKMMFAQQLEHEREEKTETERLLNIERETSSLTAQLLEQTRREAEAQQHASAITQRETENRIAQYQLELEQSKEAVNNEQLAKTAALNQAKQEAARRKAVERNNAVLGWVAALTVSALLIGAVAMITYRVPWTWLLVHPNSLALQGLAAITIFMFNIGLFVPITRKWVWSSSGIFTVLILAISLLGGLNTAP